MADEIARINEWTWGYRVCRVLEVANKIGLFGAIGDNSLSLKELCQQCRTKQAMTEKLLIACAAMGLVERDGALYKNSEFAATYLVPGGPLYQGDIIAHSDAVRGFWDGLEEEICLEAPTEDEEKTHRNFIMGMHNITVAGRGNIFIDNIDLEGRRRLLDVGGGPGTYSILACAKYPQLEAVVFDLPATIAIARQVVAEQGVTGRIGFCEGDWEKDAFGEGFDVVLLSNVMHGEGSLAETKLAKSIEAMGGGGLLVIQEFLLNNDKTGPLTAALFNVMVGAYSAKELLSLVKEAGFVDGRVVVRDDQSGAGWITAKKPG
jgi:SAM-dependent methyltransferase